MKARRPQRTHYMGQSNRNSSLATDNNLNPTLNNNNKTFDILQNSFNKTKSQYYHTSLMTGSKKMSSSIRGGASVIVLGHHNNNNNNFNNMSKGLINQQPLQPGTYYTSQLNINTIYKEAQKGHHYQFQNTKFMNNKKSFLFNNNKKNINKYANNKSSFSQQQQQQESLINPPPINMNTKLNSSIMEIKQLLMNNTFGKRNQNVMVQQQQIQQQQQEINLHKIRQLKKTFLRNNEKRRNLKGYYQKYVNKQTGKVDKNGFKRLIKQYGYDINDSEIKLVFGLNAFVHEYKNTNVNVNKNILMDNNNNNNNNSNQLVLDLPQFINLMTKQNIYFQTLKLPQKSSSQSQSLTKKHFRFQPAQFQILRNKYPRLKQALKIYKNEPITLEKFQKVMKKLDITDLVMKQQKRQQIFRLFSQQGNNNNIFSNNNNNNNFSNNNNKQLNVQKLLSSIAIQQHQRISNEKQLKLTNHDKFEQNIPANQQFKFQTFNQNDPLLELLYPKNIKTSSFVDYEKTVKQAKDICQCLKKIKRQKSKDIVKQILGLQTKLNKQQLYERVQNLLQQQGYNFNSNQYKSFISYIDFDSNNHKVSKQKLQNVIFNQNDQKRLNRLDRRLRNNNQDKSERLLPHGELSIEDKNPEDQFVDKMRAKSSVNRNTMKKTFIKEDNVPQFRVPTKFSAWPQRLYQTDLSLTQAKSTYGMGINEHSRFQKQEKHSLAQQDRLKRLLNYENKVRKVAQWQQTNTKKIQQMCLMQTKKEQSKLYNLRLLKQQYQDRCHSKSFVQ